MEQGPEELEAEIQKVSAAFLDPRTGGRKETRERWVELLARQASAFKVAQAIRQHRELLWKELMQEGAPKLVAAIDELDGKLREKLEEVQAEDALKAIETGVEDPRINLLRSLDGRLDKLKQAKTWIFADISQAIGMFNTAAS